MNGSRKARKAGPYRYLVAELGKLGFAYLHVLHAGDEKLAGDIRVLWKQTR